MLAALWGSGVGAPVDFPTEAPSGAGDEGAGTERLSQSEVWRMLLDATHRHRQEVSRSNNFNSTGTKLCERFGDNGSG